MGESMIRTLSRFAVPVLALPRPAKRAMALVLDLGLCVLSVWLAFCLRMESWVSLQDNQWWAVAVAILLALPVFIATGMYRAIFRYVGWPAMLTICKAMLIYGFFYAVVFMFIGVPDVPRTVGIIQPILLFFGLGASRGLARNWLAGTYRSQIEFNALPKVLIYGAGSAGRQLAAGIANSHEMQLVGFLDDDAQLHGSMLNGMTISDPSDLGKLVRSLQVSDILLAIPSVSRKRRNEILDQMRQANVAVRTLPGLMDLTHGRVQVSDLRELDVEDLLGRDPVPPDQILLAKNINDKVVLVTGAGGSIGSELCRQIIKIGPSALLLVELSEFALYTLHQELLGALAAAGFQVRIVPLLASVRDESRMRDIMLTWRPHTVYHAAAYKHVPLVEHNPAEGIRNNVLGTMTTATVAAEQGVLDFVLISTDKAVRPTNIMGASKRLAEMVLQALAEKSGRESSKTRFSMVRFGNVLGSSGSVVPLFRKQIESGGPITLTHADITRYFMTIPEAAQLVIQAGAMASGGDVFVLNMGEPVRIIDLARRMVRLSGLSVCDEANPDCDIEIQITGLRPGEKLYEELLVGDNPLPTQHLLIMKAHEDYLPWRELSQRLQVLSAALDINDVPRIRVLLKELVPAYQPAADVVDWIHLEQMAGTNGRVE